MLFFFFKQKTAYEMRISDWSSDVCSSDLTRSSMYSIIKSFVIPLGGLTPAGGHLPLEMEAFPVRDLIKKGRNFRPSPAAVNTAVSRNLSPSSSTTALDLGSISDKKTIGFLAWERDGSGEVS